MMSQLKEVVSNVMMNHTVPKVAKVYTNCKNQSTQAQLRGTSDGKKLFSNEAHQNAIEKLY